MVATRHTQSLTDFRQKASETLERLNRTGEAEVLTVNGEARAVLLAPAIFDELAREAQLSRDVAAMRRALRQIGEGEGRDAEEFFAELRLELLARASGKSKNGKKAR
jgi:PHD/YefM family antitoxin component YafN of YafNO toxin-antitoxin module